MSPRNILLLLAAAFLAGGLALGLSHVSTASSNCGSVLTGGGNAANNDYTDQLAGTLEGATADSDPTNNVDACHSAIDDRKPLTYGALGLGAVALIVSFVASGKREPNADGSPKPSIWR